MRYANVCIEAFGYTLPDEVVTSEELEARLEPLYRRLRLPEGRLELMTGIRERRFWPRGALPSGPSIASAQRAIVASQIDRREIGLLIHASVCRDYLEPATACSVHHALELRRECLMYDVSNACLGILNGMLQAANMIELGQIRAALIVGTESGRQLVESTIAQLNADQSLTREDVKYALASLTIGSGSAAVLLRHRELSRTGNRLLGGMTRANTDGHHLCRSGRDEAVAGDMRPLMRTDSEQLLVAGVELARQTFGSFLTELGWTADRIDRTVCHQVGQAHRKLLFQSLELDPKVDFPTVQWLGNAGSVALPITAAVAIEQKHIRPGDQLALLGIGSGINVVMLGVDWRRVKGEE
ncbi:MAG: 3-oxoacyl-ACP synthase III [Planctomycetes bacterium]|nr:3-oxoacyl-ACP synthase III [Planctomycetota bacterium]